MLIIWEGASQQETPVTEPISDQNKCDVASEDIQITAPGHLHHSHASVPEQGTSIIGFPYYKMQFLEKTVHLLLIITTSHSELLSLD